MTKVASITGITVEKQMRHEEDRAPRQPEVGWVLRDRSRTA